MSGVMAYQYTLFMFFCSVIFFPVTIQAQNTNAATASQKENLANEVLFKGNDILQFKLIGNLNDLFKDRGNNSSYHPVLLQYKGTDSNLVSIRIKVKTRGHFRRLKTNCKMPPLLLDFPKKQNEKSLFKDQHKLKLVVPCGDDDYVVREWLAYKIYNLISEKSFRARLAQVDFEDSLNKRKPETYYCILLEDEKKVAERNGAYVWKPKMLAMQNTNEEEFRKMAVFEYLIGNTDWSVPYLQNIVLIKQAPMQLPFPVPYDFDHAGIVDAPYAGPAPELGITSVRDRLYRGYCESDMKNFAGTFKLFNQLKDAIYNLYGNCPLLSKSYVKFVYRYFDDFYKTINNDRIIEKEFGKPCREAVHVELKGLKD
jgi:hypothetical protein